MKDKTTSNINNEINNINNNSVYIRQIKIYDFDRYEGQIINEIKEGKGKFYYNNGDIYEGYFRNDKFEGKEYSVLMMVICI